MIGSARQQWQEGSRRLRAETADPVRQGQLHDLVAVVAEELRKRVGERFTLGELAAAYAGADDWVREVVREALPPKSRVGIGDAALVQDAAFDVYARGARDWQP
jgi:hypothetical protein